MTSRLFEPFSLGPVQLPNRLVVAPMCQYSAVDGSATEWHQQHLSQLAYSGAGLVVVEATAVERRGRITHDCLGLYSDENEAALAHVIAAARRFAGPTKLGIQLAHAGRKASTRPPWQGGAPLTEGEGPWPTVSSSALPFTEGWHVPHALTGGEIAQIIDAFVLGAQRALRIGFDVIELHCAHGYLMHEFLSPLANHRDDEYGGSLDNRMRFPLAEKIRKATGMTTRAVGLITDPRQAEEILESGQADLIALARAFMDDPRWGWHAADKLGGTVHSPQPYHLARSAGWRKFRDSIAE